MPFVNNNKDKSRAASYLPHRQLFKPENTIEGIFVGLSVCSVLVLILSNLVSIDNNIKIIIPQFIAGNFQQIMNVLHIFLIVYVLFEMRKMYEDIREIRPHKEKMKIAVKQVSLLRRWQRFIEENIDFLKTEKKCYLYDKDKDEECVVKINRRIKIANANMKLTFFSWTCVWAVWLIMYILLFVSSFQEKTLAKPDTNQRKIETSIIDKEQAYDVKEIVHGKTDSLDTVLRIVNFEKVIPLANAYETTRSQTVFSRFRHDTLSLAFVVVESKPISQASLQNEHCLREDYRKEQQNLKHLYMFFENTLGHIVNFLMFLMFFVYKFNYVGFAQPKKFTEKSKESKESKEIKEIKEEYRKEDAKCRKEFILYFAIVSVFTITIILVDRFFLTYSDSKNKQFCAQFIVSALACISMMFLFGQLNNGKLRLPGVAVIVMFFYAAIQLFTPFRNVEVMQPIGFLKTSTFDIIVITLCFIAKFMVFFIIRWMFTGGRLAYCSFDRAICYHPEQKITSELYEYLF